MDQLLGPAPVAFGCAIGASRHFPQQPGGFSDVAFRDGGFGWQCRTHQFPCEPVAGGIAYVQSFYEWPPDAPPSVAGVVLLQRGEIRTGATLSEALGVTRLLAANGTASLRARVAALYDAMSAAMRRGISTGR